MKPIRALATVALTFLTFSSLHGTDEPSLIGQWKGSPEGESNTVVTLEFKEDGTGTMGMNGASFDIDYVFDRSVTPHTLDFTGTPPGAPGPQNMLTIVEFVDADTLKVAEPEKERPGGYDEGDTLIAKRTTGNEETASNPGVEGEEPGELLIGTWVMADKTEAVKIEFKGDGNGTLWEGPEEMALTYEFAASENPMRIILTIEGKTRHSLLEFVSKDKVKITEPEEEVAESMESASLFERQP